MIQLSWRKINKTFERQYSVWLWLC